MNLPILPTLSQGVWICTLGHAHQVVARGVENQGHAVPPCVHLGIRVCSTGLMGFALVLSWYATTVRYDLIPWIAVKLAWLLWGLIWQWTQRLPRWTELQRVKTKVNFSFMAHLLPNLRRFLYAALHGRPTEMPDALDCSANVVERHSIYAMCFAKKCVNMLVIFSNY